MLTLIVGGKYLSHSEVMVEIVSSEQGDECTIFIDANGSRYFPDGEISTVGVDKHLIDRYINYENFIKRNSLVSEIKPGDPRPESFIAYTDKNKGINDYRYPENPNPLSVQVGKSYHTEKGILIKIVAQVFLDVLNTEEGRNCYSAFKGDNNTLYDLEGRQLFRVIGQTEFSKPDDLSFEYGATLPHKNTKDVPATYEEAVKVIQDYFKKQNSDGFITINATKSIMCL